MVDKVNHLPETFPVRQLHHHASAVRDFNRFYTTRIGALGDSYVESGFSLTEVRVLYELAHRDAPTASEIAAALSLDAGYLSRMLASFRKRGLVTARPDANDRRHARLRLTAAGRRAFAPLDQRAREAVVGLLEPLGAAERARMVQAMSTIRRTLDRATPAASFTLREHRPGDIGWIVHRHGVLYAEEYGYDERFEALVAGIVARFVQKLDRKRERCWIAERDGQIVGTIFVVAKSKTAAQLRLLLVEPSARGLGLGSRLVDEVVKFSRQAGYKRVDLWTQSELTAARRLYEAAGFERVSTEKHKMFGKPTTAEFWRLDLGPKR
jgi:DNA-binding MarR family transcriptional regulator/N-acetylglutamate synthase-like GNAT family acetyltransferase